MLIREDLGPASGTESLRFSLFFKTFLLFSFYFQSADGFFAASAVVLFIFHAPTGAGESFVQLPAPPHPITATPQSRKLLSYLSQIRDTNSCPDDEMRIWTVLLVFGLATVVTTTEAPTFPQATPSTGGCPAGGGACGCNGCCVAAHGVCCQAGCCPGGYFCVDAEGVCRANNTSAHPLAPWQPMYHLCPAGLPLQTLRLTRPAGFSFPYYASMPVDRGSAARMAVVVIHGAARNADSYFCGMKESVLLQERWASEDVLVVAPWFMEPQDNPPPAVVYWDGDDPNGVWRAGKQSSAAVSPTGETVSSYTVLDLLVTNLLDKSLHPQLEALTIVGHSSGGQTVQRYALTHHWGLSAFVSTMPASDVSVRFVVANPSSYCYLDARRWINNTLMVPPPAVQQVCPEFNGWEWGLNGSFPPYVAAAGPAAELVKRYAALDVVYLLGQNDTCNEQLEPGCHSHGLETTCMDNLEGWMRLYRGLHFYTYLQIFYALQRQVHMYALVPNVGHDNTLMFQSPQGLSAIFGRPTHKPLLVQTSATVVAVAVVATLILVLMVSYLFAKNRSAPAIPCGRVPGPTAKYSIVSPGAVLLDNDEADEIEEVFMRDWTQSLSHK